MQISDASSWINFFYINNDNSGPYLPLPDSGSGSNYKLEDAAFAIPFLRKDVLIDADEASMACHGLLDRCIDQSAVERLPNLILRVYMQERADFRASIMDGDLSNEAKIYYREKWLPKRIWIAEICLRDGYGSLENKKSRVGEILLDPYSDPSDGHFLSIRLGSDLTPPNESKGILIDRNPFDGAIEVRPIPGVISSALVRTN